MAAAASPWTPAMYPAPMTPMRTGDCVVMFFFLVVRAAGVRSAGGEDVVDVAVEDVVPVALGDARGVHRLQGLGGVVERLVGPEHHPIAADLCDESFGHGGVG